MPHIQGPEGSQEGCGALLLPTRCPVEKSPELHEPCVLLCEGPVVMSPLQSCGHLVYGHPHHGWLHHSPPTGLARTPFSFAMMLTSHPPNPQILSLLPSPRTGDPFMPPTHSSAGLHSWAHTAGEPCHPLMTLGSARCTAEQPDQQGWVGWGRVGETRPLRREQMDVSVVRTHPSAGAGAVPWGPSPCPLPADTAWCPTWPSNGPAQCCPGAYPCDPAVQAECL